MLELIMCILVIMSLALIVIFTRNTVVPKYIKFGGYIAAIIATFLPNYTLTVMDKTISINVLYIIRGINFQVANGYDINIKSNLFYLALYIIPVIGIIVTVAKDSKLANIITAILSIFGVIMGCMMLFKQFEISSIFKLSVDIGLVVMLIGYGFVLAISIIKIYSHINNEENRIPIEPHNMDEENLEDYFQKGSMIICPKCGQENIPNCNYCKKCGERL